MSLFPAYSELSADTKSEDLHGRQDWLSNTSFPTQTQKSKSIENLAAEKVIKKSQTTKKRKKSKKSKKEDETDKIKKICLDSDEFSFDTKGYIVNSSKKSLPKDVRPKYSSIYPGLYPSYLKYKKVKLRRYFKKYKDSSCDTWTDNIFNDETLAVRKKEEFNKKLEEDPHDISTWIEFVEFQDMFYNYQHIEYKSETDRLRAAGQHKLSILDKAVHLNPNSKELQTMWLLIGTEVLPSEEMSKRIENILEDSGGTMTLWLGLMTTTQYSLARCTVPSISRLFEKLLVNFQKVKKSESHVRDINVLELLFHYGRFLDNCGLWENLWLIIVVNLQFNTSIKLNLEIDVDEKVKKLEDEVVKQDKHAVWQMWSQMERIREGFHFIPKADSVDYPQRCIEPEIVVNFTWHFHPEFHFQVIVTFIALMKVPLLPTSHTALKMLAPNALPWVFDSPEFIMSCLLMSPAVKLQHNYLNPVAQLTRGPQYLRKLYGQNEFLDLIVYTFEECLKCLQGKQKTALALWWLRFERWIHLLNKHNLARLPSGRKTAKSIFKNFLGTEENRENLLFYAEYCLLQYDQGNTDSCIKALKTLISSKPAVNKLIKDEDKQALTAVYRTLCEVLIGTNQKQEALKLLLRLGDDYCGSEPLTISLILSTEKKFKQIGIQLLEELDKTIDCSMEDLLLPHFIIDWISCYFWLIALTKPTIQLRNRYDEIVSLLQNYNSLMADHVKESLCETILLITWTFEKNNLLYVNNMLQKCHTSYSKNLKILNFMADNSLEFSKLWLTVRKSFLSPPSTLSCIFLICVGLEKFLKDKDNLLNRMINLFNSVALKEGKLSSIIHCLRLRFLYEYDNGQLDVAQLQALESCPWSKTVYMESILLLPAKLMQLTDVLIEKEMKIHITPDEIHEMRD